MTRMSSGIRELRVWQESVSLAGDVVKVVRQGMRRETRCIAEAVMLTALSVGSHVADGYARPTIPEQRESYLAAKRALLRLETELAVARHAELVPAASASELTTRAAQTGRMLTAFLAHLDRQLAEEVSRNSFSERNASATSSSPLPLPPLPRPDSDRAPS